MKSATAILVAAVIVLVGTGAQAATVTFTLVNNWDHDHNTGVSKYAPGRWALYATASQGDNLGMSRWGVTLTGWETRQNVSPRAYYANPFLVGGFDSSREPPGDTIDTADNPGETAETGGTVPVQSMLLILGFGQSAGSMTGAAPPGSAVIDALLIQDNYGVLVSPIQLNGSDSFLNLPLGTLLLARGMKPADSRVDFVIQSVANFAGVYVDSSGTTAPADLIWSNVDAIPEPGALVWAAVGGVLSMVQFRLT